MLAAKFQVWKPFNAQKSTKCRLKRTSFLCEARRLSRQDPELLKHTNKITPCYSLTAWTASLASIHRSRKESELLLCGASLPTRALGVCEYRWLRRLPGMEESTFLSIMGQPFQQESSLQTIRWSRTIPTGKFSTNYKVKQMSSLGKEVECILAIVTRVLLKPSSPLPLSLWSSLPQKRFHERLVADTCIHLFVLRGLQGLQDWQSFQEGNFNILTTARMHTTSLLEETKWSLRDLWQATVDSDTACSPSHSAVYPWCTSLMKMECLLQS